jgi:hypothetical protein
LGRPITLAKAQGWGAFVDHFQEKVSDKDPCRSYVSAKQEVVPFLGQRAEEVVHVLEVVCDDGVTPSRILESPRMAASAPFVLAGRRPVVYVYVNPEPSVLGRPLHHIHRADAGRALHAVPEQLPSPTIR